MGKTLKQAREEMGYSLTKLAQLTGIGRSTLGNYETGRAGMSSSKVRHLAECLKMPVGDLLPGTAPPALVTNVPSHKICRIPADCDLPARLAAMEKEMGEIRKLLISLLASERSRGAEGSGAEVKGDEKKAV